MTISVKKRSTRIASQIFISIVETMKKVHPPTCYAVVLQARLRKRLRTYSISTLNLVETDKKVMLIKTRGLIMLLLASAGKFHADTFSKAQTQCVNGLKLLKGLSQIAATNHAKANRCLTRPLMNGTKERCLIQAFNVRIAELVLTGGDDGEGLSVKRDLGNVSP